MEKMEMKTRDITRENVEKIGYMFPHCVTESRDEDGNLKKVIDFEALKQEFSLDVVEGDEAYDFTWVGKKASIVEANTPTNKTLRPCKEESVNWDTTENLYIEGDNLEVLKILQESYLGKVKMIYIDPPYNTGNDFVYRDDFKHSREAYLEESGEIDDEGNRLFRNTDSNGRFHSDWCSMMYSRLKLAKNLLSEDGVIFISIDDNEIENLRKICDEILGENNFVAQFIWRGGRRNLAKYVSTSHEYLLCFGKNLNEISNRGITWEQKKKGLNKIYSKANEFLRSTDKDYSKASKLLKDWFFSLNEDDESKAHKHYCNIDKRGVYFASDISKGGGGGPRWDVINPNTGNIVQVPQRGWSYSSLDKLLDDIKNDMIHFNGDGVPCKKRYLKDKESQIIETVFYKDRRGSSQRLRRLFEGEYFPFPKDEYVIKDFCECFSNKKSLILDFFSGSATTAHAVMQLNAEDGGNRKYIMVQLPEETDENSEAYKAGYKNICEIGKERIRRAAKKIHEDNPDAKFDDGFRDFKLDSSNMKDVYYSADGYSKSLLDELESNIKEDRTDLDLLFGCLLDWGAPINRQYESVDIDGCKVHFYDEDLLVACFDENISDDCIKEIAKRKPQRVVFRDSSFKDSPSKINVEETFKLLSPNTIIKVI